MAQMLRTLAVLTEAWDSLPSLSVGIHNHMHVHTHTIKGLKDKIL